MKDRIVMPRLGVNDDKVMVAQFLVEDGAAVKKGQAVAVLETSKETGEICAPSDGVISFLIKEETEAEVGTEIALISASREAHEETAIGQPERKLTEKAKRLAEKHGIDLRLLPSDKIIREKDLLPYIQKPYEMAEVTSNQAVIYGGGGFGKIAVEILRQDPQFAVYGIVDSNFPDKKEVLGVPVIGDDEILERLLKEGRKKMVNAVGFLQKAHWRKPTYEMLKEKGFEFINVIHRSAVVEQSVTMGAGNLICAGAIIGSEVKIGSNCILNAGCVISHDCKISDHCHIASGATLAGNVTVGENTLIGQGCTVYSDVRIGKNVTVQNGVHIFKNVEDGAVVLLNG